MNQYLNQKVVGLSHFLSESTPCYGGKKNFQRESATCLGEGHTSNSQRWTFHNHVGTHMDFPRHFSDAGNSLNQIPLEQFLFHRPFFWERRSLPGEILRGEDFREKIPLEADALLLKTGFEDYREQEVYWQNNPGLAPELGHWLRAYRPRLRLVGFDFMSLSSYSNRELGREAHRAFLCPEGGGASILIVEDMKLSGIFRSPQSLLMAPLLVESADGSPVTVFSFFE